MKELEQTGRTVDVSVIVVSYNTADLTLACLRSVYEQTRDQVFEIIVVDNASSDDSVRRIAENYPDVRLLASKHNHGFGVGTNIGVDNARGNWILLLNPDTVVKDAAIDNLMSFAKSAQNGAIFGGRTVDRDGVLDPTSCWGKTTPWTAFCRAVGLTSVFRKSALFNQEEMVDWARDSVRTVDIITGCFLLVRRDNWMKIGGFDPRFFMYSEEADLCLRAKKMALECVFCPSAEIMHYGGASETVHADKAVRLFRSKSQLFSLHWGKYAAIFGVVTLNLWAFSRMFALSLAAAAAPGLSEKRQTWSSIWSRRHEWHGIDVRRFADLSESEMKIPKID